MLPYSVYSFQVSKLQVRSVYIRSTSVYNFLPSSTGLHLLGAGQGRGSGRSRGGEGGGRQVKSTLYCTVLYCIVLYCIEVKYWLYFVLLVR